MADGRLAIGASGGYPDHESIWLSINLVDWEDFTGDLPQASWPFNDLYSHDGWFFKTGGTPPPLGRMRGSAPDGKGES